MCLPLPKHDNNEPLGTGGLVIVIAIMLAVVAISFYKFIA